MAAILGAVVALCVLVGPSSTEAQPTRTVYRIGYLSTESATSSYRRPLETFLEELRDLGWVEGQNIAIEYRYAEGRGDRLASLATDLVRLKVDLIAAWPTASVVAARNATRTIPIVGVGLTEPVTLGLVVSLARPGGNVTGVTYSVDSDIFGKQLELLTEVVPRGRQVAALTNPSASPAYPLMLKSLRAAAQTLGVQLRLHEVRDPGQFDAAFAAMARERTAALLIFGDPAFFLHRGRLTSLALKHRLPSMSTQRQWVEAGGLIAYGPSLPDLWLRAASYVDRILRGTQPSDLPVEQPTIFELGVNLKTAKALGLSLPQSLLLRADTVIE